jgi:hypothetical protein
MDKKTEVTIKVEIPKELDKGLKRVLERTVGFFESLMKKLERGEKI